MKSFLVRGSQTRYWLPQILAVLLALPPSLRAQTPAQLAPVASLQTEDLRVVVLAGNGETNDLKRLVMSPLVVQVLDQDGRPIEGAQVVFSFPVQGPSATFANKQSSQTTRTNADGQAAATGWVGNAVGMFQVKVTASRGNETGQAIVTMTNATKIVETKRDKGKSWWSSKWAKIGVIAVAGAVIAVVLVTRGDKSTTVTALPGSPSIGVPQ